MRPNYFELRKKKTTIYDVIGWLIFIGVIVGAGLAWYAFCQYSCDVRGQAFEDADFKIAGGCMVKHKGKWLPIENIRGFDDK